MSIAQEVGTRIRRERINKGFSQDNIATELGLTVGAYAKIERGETDPSVTRLYELAKIIKVDILAFLSDDLVQDATSISVSSVTRAEFDDLERRVSVIQKKLGLKAEISKQGKKSATRAIPKKK